MSEELIVEKIVDLMEENLIVGPIAEDQIEEDSVTNYSLVEKLRHFKLTKSK